MSTLIFNATLLATAWYVLSAGRKLSAGRLAVALLGGLALAAGGMGIWLAFNGEGPFGLMRLWCWAIFVHGPLWLFYLGWRSGSESPKLRWASALGGLFLLVVAADAFLIEPHWLEVSRVTIATDKVSRPTRLVLVADVQTDHVGAYEREVLEEVMRQKPDAILFAGDYVHMPDEEARVEQEALAELLVDVGLSAPLGIFAVSGNTDAPGWERVFSSVDSHVFTERGTIESQEISVTGITFLQSFSSATTVDAAPGFHIVLGHAPDFALNEIDADLLLAGHCHGGQVCLPFFGPPLTLTRVPRAWTSGLTEINPGTHLVVSRGVGLERANAPRLRFLCRPEIVVIDLVPVN